MIPIPTGVRVWLATGHTNMRRGFPSLSLQVQEVLRQDPPLPPTPALALALDHAPACSGRLNHHGLPSRGPRRMVTQTWLSNRAFDTYKEIIETACDAWRRLVAQPHAITSIGSRAWAINGQT